MPIVHADELRRLGAGIFGKMGVPGELATVVSNTIVENSLYGHDSHGALLIPRFAKDLDAGKIKPEARTEITRTAAGTARVDGHRGFGQVTMTDAMALAMEMARDSGVSAVSVTDCNHVGMLWSYVRTAAEAGMIAMIWCASGPQGGCVAPTGGRRGAIGTNPVAAGIPAGRMKPLVLDISTSAAAMSKVLQYARHGKELPDGWILDDQGDPSTDPNDLRQIGAKMIGALLPMGGHKGFGLALVVEALGNVVTGYGSTGRPDYKEGNGVFIVVVDIEKFLPLAEFREAIDNVFTYIKATPTDSRTTEILIPGEIEYRTREERLREGIPVDEVTWADIVALAEKLGVAIQA